MEKGGDALGSPGIGLGEVCAHAGRLHRGGWSSRSRWWREVDVVDEDGRVSLRMRDVCGW